MNENKFDGMGNIYSQFRPSYPSDFIDYLKKNVSISRDKIIADIGSGTGILSKQLLLQGNVVYAVEPNKDMRIVAETDLKKYENFISIDGTAENTKLESTSIDYITVAQAFHWFNRQKFKDECQRILKHDGKVVLVWNSRDYKSNFVIEGDAINRKYCPDFTGFSGGQRGAENEDDFSDFFNGTYETKTFRNDLKFDEQSFIGRNLSASYALKESDYYYTQYIAELKSLFKKYCKDGNVIMENLTRSYVGTV